MKYWILILAGVMLAATIGCSGSVRADAALEVAAPSGAYPAPVTYRFGEVSRLDASRVSHDFHFRNDTSAPEIVSELRPSCGCTSALIASGAGAHAGLPYTLAPGERVVVRVTTNLQFLKPGALDKFVYVDLLGQQQPAAVFEMRGTLLPPIRVMPTALDFGNVPAGQARTLLIHISLDSSLLAGRTAPYIASSDPAIGIAPVTSPESADTAKMGNAQPASDLKLIAAPTASPDLIQTYRVTLSPNTQ